MANEPAESTNTTAVADRSTTSSEAPTGSANIESQDFSLEASRFQDNNLTNVRAQTDGLQDMQERSIPGSFTSEFAERVSSENVNRYVDGQTGTLKVADSNLYRENDLVINGMPLTRRDAGGQTSPPPDGRVSDSGPPAGSDSGTGTPTDKAPESGKERRQTGDPALDAQLNKLYDNIDNPNNKLDATQQQTMRDSINRLLDGKLQDGSDRKPPLTNDQKAEVLNQTNRLFDKSEYGKMQEQFRANGISDTETEKVRNNLAASMVRDAADPTQINQGQHNTCNVTTALKVANFESPEKTAKLAVDMYTNAKGDGTVNVGNQSVRYDVKSLVGDRETERSLNADDKGKSWDQYTRGMSHLLVNVDSQQRGEMYTLERAGQYGQNDTGERRYKMDANGNKVGGPIAGADGKPDSSPAMGVDQVARVTEALVGTDRMVANSDRFGKFREPVDNVRNAADLAKAWEANGGGPMIAAVDTRHAMFHATGVGGYGGGHVVVISDRREVTGPNGEKSFEYKVNNSWGEKYNGWVSGDQLAASMNPTGQERYSPTAKGDGPPAVQPGGGGGQVGPAEQERQREQDRVGPGGEPGPGQEGEPRRSQDGIRAKEDQDPDAQKRQDEIYSTNDNRINALESKGMSNLTEAEKAELASLKAFNSARPRRWNF